MITDAENNTPYTIVPALTNPSFVTFRVIGDFVEITITPLVDSVGTYPVSFVLTDSLMSAATYSFNVFANTAPTFTTPLSYLSLVEGFPSTYTLPPFVDKEGDAITVIVDLS